MFTDSVTVFSWVAGVVARVPEDKIEGCDQYSEKIRESKIAHFYQKKNKTLGNKLIPNMASFASGKPSVSLILAIEMYPTR